MRSVGNEPPSRVDPSHHPLISPPLLPSGGGKGSDEKVSKLASFFRSLLSIPGKIVRYFDAKIHVATDKMSAIISRIFSSPATGGMQTNSMQKSQALKKLKLGLIARITVDPAPYREILSGLALGDENIHNTVLTDNQKQLTPQQTVNFIRIADPALNLANVLRVGDLRPFNDKNVAVQDFARVTQEGVPEYRLKIKDNHVLMITTVNYRLRALSDANFQNEMFKKDQTLGFVSVKTEVNISKSELETAWDYEDDITRVAPHMQVTQYISPIEKKIENAEAAVESPRSPSPEPPIYEGINDVDSHVLATPPPEYEAEEDADILPDLTDGQFHTPPNYEDTHPLPNKESEIPSSDGEMIPPIDKVI